MIYIVLTGPGIKRDLVNAKIYNRLLDLALFADERDCACTELWWVGAWHVSEPFMKAIN